MIRLETEAVLDAPPARVWAALADFAGYAAWNPLLREARGEARPGARVAMKVEAPDGSGRRYGFVATIVRAEPGRSLVWRGGVPLILRGEHYFHLSPAGEGTRLVHGEEFHGIFARLLGEKRIQGFAPAYAAMNRALAERLARG